MLHVFLLFQRLLFNGPTQHNFRSFHQRVKLSDITPNAVSYHSNTSAASSTFNFNFNRRFKSKRIEMRSLIFIIYFFKL